MKIAINIITTRMYIYIYIYAYVCMCIIVTIYGAIEYTRELLFSNGFLVHIYLCVKFWQSLAHYVQCMNN